MFPKWGLATGKGADRSAVRRHRGARCRPIHHHYAEFTYVFSGSDVFVVEGTKPRGAQGRALGRAGRAGMGRRPVVRRPFEIRDFLIQRCFIYLDPDYAGRDTARYPWLPQS